MTQWIYRFGNGLADGRASDKEKLGGKGANLAEMSHLGLPVPLGFTITTEVCRYYYAHQQQYPLDLQAQVTHAIQEMEQTLGQKLGDASNPLLVSVRSGAAASMPGMMDTILNLGLNDATTEGLSACTGNARFAYDSYRRFIQMFSDVVLGVDHYYFEDILDEYKATHRYKQDTDLQANDWQTIITRYKSKVKEATGNDFPQDVNAQLWAAVNAVFSSWMSPRAIVYRRLNNMPDTGGTAVNIQAMVFGNRGDDCATGVAFTRNPSTGLKELYGEYLINAQGEDVVAGIRTPQFITTLAAQAQGSNLPSMEQAMPEVYQQLVSVCQTLEQHFHDMQDIEFTVQHNTLWLLQTRNGKRTTAAALKVAVDMVQEGLITKEEALLRLDPAALDQLLHPSLDPKAPKTIITQGLAASPGAASGTICFTPDAAESLAKKGQKVLLVRIETSPEDIHGMHAATGIITSRGGMTSHAAVVARGMGRPCVSGAHALQIDYTKQTLTVNGKTWQAGDPLTIDGSTGHIYDGVVPTIEPALNEDFTTLMSWADSVRTMNIMANAETPLDASVARRFGAEGIGLCRTEHMFFQDDRIMAVRTMIIAQDEATRQAALDTLLPMQQQDFVELFNIMAGFPVMVRLLDPPLHEFLPPTDKEMHALAKHVNLDVDRVRKQVEALHEVNPMLGHRGCRLGVTFPEIYAMQVKAIFNAQAAVMKTSGQPVIPQIMLPLIATEAELVLLRQRIDAIATERQAALGMELPYKVGTMIELPRAALQAGAISQHADFFSFGTNDLTQTTYGLSRDDASRFLPAYMSQGLLSVDPFVTLDEDGVGELLSLATSRGRASNPRLKVGICGEHGGDPQSIAFCHRLGMDYVSCSAYRVPIARLAAAQAALRFPHEGKTAKVA